MDFFKNTAKIKVVGVGGGGVNAIDRMIQDGLAGVDFIAVNTDAQSLAKSEAETKIDIGRDVSSGLGAGADPSVGQRAAEENIDLVRETLQDADMVFVAAGEGGGTGTGAAPVVAKVARDLGALTVGVVTRPFGFEGSQRMRNANSGISELRDAVDALIVIPNDRLLEYSETDIGIIEAFRKADEVLQNGVRGISDLITNAGIVNLDFADVKTIMKNAGTALMGLGSATGVDRCLRATENAIDSPLLEARIEGAHGVLMQFKAATDLGMREYGEAAQLVKEMVDPNANIIVGFMPDESLGDEVYVTVIAAGFDESNDYLLTSSAPAVAKRAEAAPLSVPRVDEPSADDMARQSHVSAPLSAQQEQASRGFASDPVPAVFEDENEHKRPDLDIPPFLFGED